MVAVNGKTSVFSASFLIAGIGYYDYQEPLVVNLPGLEKVGGEVVHPQFWPQELEYSGNESCHYWEWSDGYNMLPVLAQKASKVTILQRSPG